LVMVKVTIEIPDPLFDYLELLAFMKGVSVDIVLRDIIVNYVNTARDIIDMYYFKTIWVPKVTRELTQPQARAFTQAITQLITPTITPCLHPGVIAGVITV